MNNDKKHLDQSRLEELEQKQKKLLNQQQYCRLASFCSAGTTGALVGAHIDPKVNLLNEGEAFSIGFGLVVMTASLIHLAKCKAKLIRNEKFLEVVREKKLEQGNIVLKKNR